MRRAPVYQFRHPSAVDRRVAVPPRLLRDIVRVLRDHGHHPPPDDVNTALAWLAEQATPAGRPRLTVAPVPTVDRITDVSIVDDGFHVVTAVVVAEGPSVQHLAAVAPPLIEAREGPLAGMVDGTSQLCQLTTLEDDSGS